MAEGWIRHAAERRVRRELSAWDPRPGLHLTPLFRWRRPEVGERGAIAVQHFRSLVQVNFYPRPR